MYSVSDAWIKAQNAMLSPEGFVEISCYIPELKDTLVFTKRDLMSFSHQQTGSMVSGELPKNHIEFSLDNTDGRWKPSNPTGMERYLSERLKVTVRYGFNINGVTEWIPGGVFYLTEWRNSQNGLQAFFKARDVLEYMLDKPYTGTVSGTLYEIAERAINEAEIPGNNALGITTLGTAILGETVLGEDYIPVVHLSEELKNYTVSDIEYDGNESIAEILQKCANAGACVMYQDRMGTFRIERLPYAETGYVLSKQWAYKYPETEFARPLRNVSVTYCNGKKVVFQFGGTGETQTLDNAYIATKDQALTVAKWICDSLRTRKKIAGELRGDPRLDLFDVVDIEDKYGTIAGVVLTDIKCTFSGAFHMSYSGYIRGSGTAVIVYSGEAFSGEVV